ncbi:MAG: type II toxin-antitoxin system VapC family toxin [Chloroflexota bacterium]
MILVDVNVLVYAFDEEATDHATYRAWLESALDGDEPVGIADEVLAAFVRLVTHPRVLVRPAPVEAAFAFANAVRDAPASVPVVPGERRWTTFERLCRAAGARGNLVPDAWLAAVAMDSGAVLVTTDRDFSRFPGLRWRLPFEPA